MTTSQTSTRLDLPLLQPAQALKHITINEAIRLLDWLVQLSVTDRALTSPPTNPEDGAAYILGPNADGDWSDWPDGSLALRDHGDWTRIDPKSGWRAYVQADGQYVTYDGANWVETDRSQDRFGVNTQADPVNRFAVKSDSALFSHDDVTPGSGDMRLVLNRASDAAAGSLLLQTDYVASAEIALDGADGLKLSVSDQGGGLLSALEIAAPSGKVTIPNGLDAQEALSCSAGNLGEFDITTLPQGFSHASVNPSNGYPGFGAVMTIRHGDNRTFQFFADGQDGALSIRANHSSNAPGQNGWTNWYRVWSEADQGSGSGLIADKVTAYDSASRPSAASRGVGALIYVSGATEGDGLAVSDGTDWHLVTGTTLLS